MFETVDLTALIRNLAVYAVGVGATVAGALGLAGAIALSIAFSALLFTGGLGAVLFVHEYLDGPL